MKKISRIRNQQFYEERFMGKSFKRRSRIGRQKDNTMLMVIQNKIRTRQYGKIQNEIMSKRFSSSTRIRLYRIIFIGSECINNFNITTNNIIH